VDALQRSVTPLKQLVEEGPVEGITRFGETGAAVVSPYKRNKTAMILVNRIGG